MAGAILMHWRSLTITRARAARVGGLLVLLVLGTVLGVEVGAIEEVGGGVKYARLADPDGNTLTLQEMAWRTGDKF